MDNLYIEPVTEKNWRVARDLSVAKNQTDFIESNAQSLLEAAYDKEFEWHPYILLVGAAPVGFAMIGGHSEERRSIWLDRFMIAEEYQGQRLGPKFLEYLKDFIFETWDVDQINLSFEPGNHHARKMYEKHGFEDTGHVDEVFNEIIYRYKDES